MPDYKDEIVGGDGIRRYDLIRADGSYVEREVQIAKAYTPEQEGSPFGATEVNEIYETMDRLRTTATTATLTAAGWSGSGPYTQTIDVDGVQASTGGVIVGLAPDSTDEQRAQAAGNGVWCSGKGDGTLTFVAQGAPSLDIPLIMLVSKGDNAIINAASGGAQYAPRLITELISTTQEWVPPANLMDMQVDVRLFGGGGRSTTGGGGGGHMAHAIVTLNDLNPVTVTIGDAATASTTAGGVTSFGAYLSANGGSGVNGGTGGGARNGAYNGGDGSYGGGGGGGTSIYGTGSNTTTSASGGDGGGFGGGGGNGATRNQSDIGNGSGVAGLVGGISKGGYGTGGGGGRIGQRDSDGDYYLSGLEAASGSPGAGTLNLGLEFEGVGEAGNYGLSTASNYGRAASGGGGGGGYGGNGGNGSAGTVTYTAITYGLGGGGGGYGADGGNATNSYGGGGGGYGGRGGHGSEGGFGGGYGIDNYGRGWGTSSYPGKSGIAILKYKVWEVVNV